VGEFKLVTERIKIGRSMEDALQDTADRLDMAEFSFFCITLAIQRETGGNLAETLSNLADVLRKRAQMKLKIKAMSSDQGLGLYRGLAAVSRLHHDLLDQPGLSGRLLHRPAADHHRAWRPVLDGHRRLHHGPDGQFRDLRRHHGPWNPQWDLFGVDVVWAARCWP
jgi:hypothetical protein